MLYQFTKSSNGHAEGEIARLTGWDEFYFSRKKVIVPYNRESAIVLETPEHPVEATESADEKKPRRKSRKK